MSINPNNIQANATILRVGTRLRFENLSVVPGRHKEAHQKLLLAIQDTKNFENGWNVFSGIAGVNFIEPGVPSDSTIVPIKWYDTTVPFGMTALKVGEIQPEAPWKIVARTTVTFPSPEEDQHDPAVLVNVALISNKSTGFEIVDSHRLGNTILNSKNAANITISYLTKAYADAIHAVAGDTTLFAGDPRRFTVQPNGECFMVNHTDSRSPLFNGTVQHLFSSTDPAKFNVPAQATVQGFEQLVQQLLKDKNFRIGQRNDTLTDRQGNAIAISYRNAGRLVGFARSFVPPATAAAPAAGTEPWESYFIESPARTISQGMVIDALTRTL